MPRLRFNAFTMNCVSHINHGQWVRKDTRQTDYNRLDPWLDLARLLERGRFDAVFLADVVGVYDTYGGGRGTAVAEGLQIPVNDPSALIPAMATVTEHLGFAFTNSVLQEHPFHFARRVTTLDHLTGGRVAWNIVTSYLASAGRNLGWGGLPPHAERYERADEYLEVLYKLWEGSWEDDAVVVDRERGVYADPARIHEINHRGRFYDVEGPHLSEPSPQRTPVLFQAGSSEAGRNFAARHAEAIFMGSLNPQGAAAEVEDTVRRAERFGRLREDILFYQGLTFIVGGTEEEARRKEAEYREHVSADGFAAHLSGGLGIDLGQFDPDQPIGEIDSNGLKGFVRSLIEAAPDHTWTWGQLMERTSWGSPVVGAPEQIADVLEQYADAGVNGINVMYVTTPGSFEDFIEGAAPELRRRGLMQTEYAPGTLREKLTDGASGPRLHSRHAGADFRRARREAVTA